MSEQQQAVPIDVSGIYSEVSDWDVNCGGNKVVAKRMGGRFRLLKW